MSSQTICKGYEKGLYDQVRLLRFGVDIPVRNWWFSQVSRLQQTETSRC